MAPKIYAHVLFYGMTLGVATGGAFLISTVFGKSEEEKIKELV
jgi:Na+-driven multidrug efflux pump